MMNWEGFGRIYPWLKRTNLLAYLRLDVSTAETVKNAVF
jgi:hypothetical protein